MAGHPGRRWQPGPAEAACCMPSPPQAISAHKLHLVYIVLTVFAYVCLAARRLAARRLAIISLAAMGSC